VPRLGLIFVAPDLYQSARRRLAATLHHSETIDNKRGRVSPAMPAFEMAENFQERVSRTVPLEQSIQRDIVPVLTVASDGNNEV